MFYYGVQKKKRLIIGSGKDYVPYSVLLENIIGFFKKKGQSNEVEKDSSFRKRVIVVSD